ncbi:unnamed protein product, partial [Oppiella nova]
MVASLTTLEKRYAFDSLVSGFILIADDVMGLISRPIFGYIANKVHRPRLIAWCMVLVGVGCFLATVPYLIYGPATHLLTASIATNKSIEFCDNTRDPNSSCDKNSESKSSVIPVIFLWSATALNGLGGAAFWGIGMPFIDDSVKKKKSPLFISFTGCMRLLGPTIAFLLSSVVLRYYENPLIDPGITDKRDPRWVGAWWLGFAIFALLILIFSLPLFLFPANLRNPKSKKIIYNINDNKQQITPKPKPKPKPHVELSLSKRLIRLLKNPIYVCYVLGTTLRLFGVLGYMTFKPKYMESQFKKSASTANLFSGLVGIIPSATGILLGGAFITYVQPGPILLTSFITVIELMGTIGFISALFLGCPPTPFAALPISNANGLDTQSMCNSNCACSVQTFHPICGPDNFTNYFSPCFAGCKSIIESTDGKPQYSMCDCVGGQGVATEGYCSTGCGNKFETYITLFGVTFIPYPLVYGAVTNTACEVWESKCGKTGNCLVYDSDKFRTRLHGLTLVLYFMGSVFDVIVIFLAKRIK